MVEFKTVYIQAPFNKRAQFLIYKQQVVSPIQVIGLIPTWIVHIVFYYHVGQCIIGVGHIGAEGSRRLNFDRLTTCIPLRFYIDIHQRPTCLSSLIIIFACIPTYFIFARSPYCGIAIGFSSLGTIT